MNGTSETKINGKRSAQLESFGRKPAPDVSNDGWDTVGREIRFLYPNDWHSVKMQSAINEIESEVKLQRRANLDADCAEFRVPS